MATDKAKAAVAAVKLMCSPPSDRARLDDAMRLALSILDRDAVAAWEQLKGKTKNKRMNNSPATSNVVPFPSTRA